MKLKFFTAALVAAALMMAGCADRQPVLTIDMGNLSGETITVAYHPVVDGDALQIDTMVMQGNTCTWNRPIEQLTKIGIKLASEENTDVEFRILPGEKAEVRIDYAFDGARFYLKGSPQLKAQADMHNETYEITRQEMYIRDYFTRLMARGVENVDETYADSLSEVYQELYHKERLPWLGFIERFPNDPRSACYLINYGDDSIFLEKYPGLGESVREGELKEFLDKSRDRSIRGITLKKAEAELTEGVAVPDFEAVDLNGKTLKLSDYADRYIVLDFWGTWCPWCVKGMPDMRKYYAKCGGKAVFIGIDTRDSKEKVSAFLEKEDILWTNVRNNEDGNPDIVLMYGVQGYPTKILIEPGLKFKKRYLGEVPEFYSDLDDIIK